MAVAARADDEALLVADQSIPWWSDDDEPLVWDTVVLGGEVMPGVASVTGSGRKRKVDVKKSNGQDKASLKDEGEEPGKLDVELLIYNRSDWARLQQLMPMLMTQKAGGDRSPMTIEHPLAALLGIATVYVVDFPIPALEKQTQFLTVKMSLIEWVPEPKKVKGGVGASGGAAEQVASPTEKLKALAKKSLQFLGFLADDPATAAENGDQTLIRNAQKHSLKP